jgi:hypothetical protein
MISSKGENKMKTLTNKLPGIALSAIIAVPAWLIGKMIPVVGSPVIGILFGMILAFWKRPQLFNDGVSYTSKKLLQYSIILLGFDMNLYNVFRVGKQTLILMAFTLTAAFLTAYFAGKSFKIRRQYQHLNRRRLRHLRRIGDCGDSAGHSRKRRGSRPLYFNDIPLQCNCRLSVPLFGACIRHERPKLRPLGRNGCQ